MKLKKVVTVVMTVGALGFGAVGFGGIANAQPGAPAPLQPGNDNPWPPPWPNNGRGDGPHGVWQGNGNWNNGHDGDWNNGHDGDWHNGHDGDWHNGDWNKSQWWATNRHDWWDDRQGAPPWGWGPPPAYQWDGGPPHAFNYYGYNANPVWNPGANQWGIWLLGIFIPIFGIGVG